MYVIIMHTNLTWYICLFGYSLDPNLPNQQTYYMEGECYDYDADIDELFVLAGKIICPVGQEEVCFIFIFFKGTCYVQLFNIFKI